MINFCTLFDKNFMSRGIVLYNSLAEHCRNDFYLYVLAMDDITVQYLSSLGHENLVIITVKDMKEMYPVLVKLEQERTRGEFCWTLSSFSIQYCLRSFNLDACTYVDSDICFYNNPQLLLDEIGDKSVLITEHNYTPEYDKTTTSGKYCVQFMYFKNNDDGNKVLEYWRSKCEEWCYARMEDGKFGDQKYLDDWESRFEGIVYNCRNIGCGVAPWNVQKYEITQENNIFYVTDRITRIKKKIVFFHYHDFFRIREKKWYMSHYPLAQSEKELLFKPYIKNLYRVEEKYPENLVIIKYKELKISIFTRLIVFLEYLKKYFTYRNTRLIIRDNIEVILDD